MNETSELLIFMHDNAKMGLTSTKKLLNLIKNKENKIKFTLEEQLQKYETFYKKIKNLLKKEKINITFFVLYYSIPAKISGDFFYSILFVQYK